MSTQFDDACRILEDRDWYEFNELSAEAQAKAIQDHISHMDGWEESVLSDCHYVLTTLGVTGGSINYSGFGSQGDGACFVGSYRYAKGGAKCIKAEHPQDTALHSIIDDLQELQRENFYGICAEVYSTTSRYHHEHTVSIDVTDRDENPYSGRVAKEVTEVLRRLMRWIYKQLESEWDYLSGYGAREAVQEEKFNEDGGLY